MKFINKYKSPNYNDRSKLATIKYIVLHYTAMKSDIEAIKHLCNKKNTVSAHFLINKSGIIFNLVNIKFRAWHAGVSYWKEERDINSNSIGIEIDNSGHHINNEKYQVTQINSLFKLIVYLKKKYLLKNENILAHSDIAPYRKIDPGEKFPWEKIIDQSNFSFSRLFDKKVSLQIDYYLASLKLNGLRNKALYMLKYIGYNIEPAKKNKKKYVLLIKAYQRHYNCLNVTGSLDKKTFEIIKSHFNNLLTI